MHKQKRMVGLALAICSLAGGSRAAESAWTLAGEQAPSEPGLWQQPATLSWTRENGRTTGTADADLRYTYKAAATPAPRGWSAMSYSAGAYLHRSDDEAAPRNDRGVSLRVARSYRFGATDPTADDAAAQLRKIDFLNLSVGAKVGKSLVSDPDATEGTPPADRNSSRLIALADYYLLPKIADRPRAADVQINLATGAYVDRAAGAGRLAGVLARGRVDVALLGLDPEAVKVSTGLAVLPVAFVAAQVQKDLAASGGRRKERYTLYSVGVAFNFAKIGGSGLVPSLVIERSIGADLLEGRARTGQTTASLGLSF